MTTNSPIENDADGKVAQENEETRSALDNPYWLLTVLFLGIGALGLPQLRRSKAFSPGTKKILAVVLVIYSALMVLILIAVIIVVIAGVIWLSFT